MKSKSPEYYSLKLVPSDDLKERIKLNPAFKNASEKLDPELNALMNGFASITEAITEGIVTFWSMYFIGILNVQCSILYVEFAM